MKIRANKGRMEIIFPVVLFLVFTLSALFIILYAARTYRQLVEESNAEYEHSTALAYISKKIQSGDTNGNIFIGDLNGNNAVIIKQDIEGEPYITYIYVYDGKLRELFTADNGNKIESGAGMLLFDVESLNAKMTGDKLMSLTISYNGNEYSKNISLQSEEPADDYVDPMVYPDETEVVGND